MCGRIDRLDKTSFALVKEAIDIYKKELRPLIPEFIPCFPGGLPDINDTTTPVILGMKHETAVYYWVWRLAGEPRVVVDRCESGKISVIYPSSAPATAEIEDGRLLVELAEPYSAVIVKVDKCTL